MAKKIKLICPACGGTRTLIKKEENDLRLCLACYKSWCPGDDVDPESVKAHGSYEEHQTILENTSLIVQAEWPDAFFVERHVGLFYTKRGTKIKIGIRGQADSYLLIPAKYKNIRFQIHIEVEYKSGGATLSKWQKVWKKEVEDRGGLYIQIKNPEDIVSIIKQKYGELIG